MRFENAWMEYFDSKWKTSLRYLKYNFCDFGQFKAPKNEYMNNNSNNTENTEILMYWNVILDDSYFTTSWSFFTYIDNLSFLGGLLDIALLVPSILMMVYTFRINEINVFFYHEVVKNEIEDQDFDDIKPL